MPVHDELVLHQCARQIRHITEEIEEMDGMLAGEASQNGDVRLLASMTGMGAYTSLLLAVEMGTVDRFESPKKMVSWAGLCPAVYQSGDRLYTGRIKKLDTNGLVNWIRRRLNARYSLCSVRRILLFLGFSSKRSATEYASAADDDTVRQWQADAAGTISRARMRGFAVVVQDESIFVRTGNNGKKLWSRVGDPVTVSRSGRRDRIVVYGALAGDGTRLMRRYDRFDGPTFVEYLGEVRRKWGKVLVIMDNAVQHKTRVVRKYLDGHREVEVLYLPTATPKLSAV